MNRQHRPLDAPLSRAAAMEGMLAIGRVPCATIDRKILPPERTLDSVSGGIREPLQRTVSEPLNLSLLRLSAERKQTPQIVEKPGKRIGLKEALEAIDGPPEQKVGGSNPIGRTIKINCLRPIHD